MARYLDRKITFKVTPEEFVRIEACARSSAWYRPKTVSALVRTAVLDYLKVLEAELQPAKSDNTPAESPTMGRLSKKAPFMSATRRRKSGTR